ncbi:GNAT family N-acetyltransferase [Albimonas sp. CAU 1670]|uniref:GNAT family N-acetyltransferase n=1 Tax=Albimonas sp. CAU 1670 TaxID=3032599 RepID=UPI0023DAB43F|nr:GNAT family N-acetyltransferase [Albimonas sp. CAU 1670]MDF2232665.1 GNAT family N-acetyltransferase [Albimonas sp. CAU 1670]
MRPAGPADLALAVALFSDPRMLAHRPDPTPPSREALAEEMAQAEAAWARDGVGRWRLDLREGGEAGFGGLGPRPGREGLNLSFHVAPALQGRGLAGEFVAGALALAFGVLEAEQVYGLARPWNAASLRVLERAGFEPRGKVELHGAPSRLMVRRRA